MTREQIENLYPKNKHPKFDQINEELKKYDEEVKDG